MNLGKQLGAKLPGGQVIELVADLGGGKTTFTQGLAQGLGSLDQVSSPTFTINKIYSASGGRQIHHFDFYRLSEPGIIADQLQESLADPKVITVVEWSDVVKDVLPPNRLTIKFELTSGDPDERLITINYPESLQPIIKSLESESGVRP